jgi:hypothetical protein
MWHAVGPVIRECARTGHAQLNHNQPLPIMRYGYMEEAFFTWSFVSVDAMGSVLWMRTTHIMIGTSLWWY